MTSPAAPACWLQESGDQNSGTANKGQVQVGSSSRVWCVCNRWRARLTAVSPGLSPPLLLARPCLRWLRCRSCSRASAGASSTSRSPRAPALPPTPPRASTSRAWAGGGDAVVFPAHISTAWCLSRMRTLGCASDPNAAPVLLRPVLQDHPENDGQVRRICGR